MSVGTADGSHLPPSGGRGVRRAASSRTRVVQAGRLVYSRRPNRICALRGDGQYLDDVTLFGALMRKGAGAGNAAGRRGGRGSIEMTGGTTDGLRTMETG